MSAIDALGAAISSGLYAGLLSGLNAVYFSSPVPTWTNAYFAQYFVQQAVPPIAQTYSSIIKQISMVTYTYGIATVAYIIAIALWSFAVHDKRNVRSALMLGGSIFGLLLTAIATYSIAHIDVYTEAQGVILTIFATIAIQLPLLSSLYQSSALWNSKQLQLLFRATVFAASVVIAVLATYYTKTDSQVCGGYPCTPRSRYSLLPLPIMYALFSVGVWSLTLYRKMASSSGSSANGASAVRAVAVATASFGALITVNYIMFIVYWTSLVSDSITSLYLPVILCFIPCFEFASDYFVRAQNAAKSLTRGATARSPNTSGHQGQSTAKSRPQSIAVKASTASTNMSVPTLTKMSALLSDNELEGQ